MYALADSPVGLAADLLDHNDAGQPAATVAAALRRTSITTGDLTRDDILDNILLFWLTNTAVSSARLYWENKVAFFTARASPSRSRSASSRRALRSAAHLDGAAPIRTSSITTDSRGAAISPPGKSRISSPPSFAPRSVHYASGSHAENEARSPRQSFVRARWSNTGRSTPASRCGESDFIWIEALVSSGQRLRRPAGTLRAAQPGDCRLDAAGAVSKVDLYDDQIFVVLKSARLEGDAISYGEIGAFVSGRHIITVYHGADGQRHATPTKNFMTCRSSFTRHRTSSPTPLNFIVGGYFPVVQMVEEDVLSMEQHLQDALLIAPK